MTKDETEHDGHRAHGVFGSRAQSARDHAAEADRVLDLQVRRDRTRRSRQRRRRRDGPPAESGDRFVIGRGGDRGDIRNMSVERRVDATDTLGDRRVGGEERLQEAGRAREEHVLGFKFRGGSLALRAGQTSDFFQRRGEAERVTGELDRGGVREVFALTRDRGLDHAGEEDAPEPDQHDDEAGDGQRPEVILAG